MKGDHRFEWAEDADYKYDSRDLSIPGLGIDLDPTHPEGFSCPVFFDRKVLGIFYNDSDYELDFFSESYGTIAEKGTCGYQYEWNIPFGINENDKVILFLGDLDEIDKDDRAVLWLKSYNIPSDHCIVDTELYQAQLNCVFSEPIIEKRIISLRNLFYQRVKNIYGIDLFHLENECESSANRIRKPLNYSESELRENMILLDGLLNEGSLAWSSIVLALKNIKGEVVDRPKALGDIRGVTYIYGMFYRFGLIDVPDEVKEKMGHPKNRKKQVAMYRSVR